MALAKADAATLELWWPQKAIRPDVTLSLDRQPTLLLEVVVTHGPECEISRVGLPVLELHPGVDFNLEVLERGSVPFAKAHNLDCGCSNTSAFGEAVSACTKCGRASEGDDFYYSDYLREYPLCRSCLPSRKDMTHSCKGCGNSFQAKRDDHDFCRDCWRIESQREEWKFWHCQRCQRKLKRPGYTYCWACNQAVREEERQRAQQVQAAEEKERETRRREAEEELDREGADLNALVAELRQRAEDPSGRRTPEA